MVYRVILTKDIPELVIVTQDIDIAIEKFRECIRNEAHNPYFISIYSGRSIQQDKTGHQLDGY